MSIQGSVNQSLSILGALYTQTPMYKEKHALPSEEEKLLKSNEEISATLKAGKNERKTGLSNDPETSKLFKEKYENLGKLARIDPKYVDEWVSMRPIEEEGTAKAAESLRKSIEKKEYQKSRVGQFYKSLKDQSFIREVKDGKSIK